MTWFNWLPARISRRPSAGRASRRRQERRHPGIGLVLAVTAFLAAGLIWAAAGSAASASAAAQGTTDGYMEVTSDDATVINGFNHTIIRPRK